MKVLLDQNTPRALRQFLSGHAVKTAREMGWEAISNGLLLQMAEAQFELMITADKNIRYQQNLSGRKLAILVLPTNRWPELRLHLQEVVAAVSSMHPGEYREIIW